MLQSAKIKIRNIKELQADNIDLSESAITSKTPLRKRKKARPAITATKLTLQDDGNDKNVFNGEPLTTVKKRLAKSALREPPSWQKPIDSYFKSCQKTYRVEPLKEQPPTPIGKNAQTAATKTKSKKKCVPTTTANKIITRSNRKRLGRKRLFVEPDLTTETETTCSYKSSGKEPTLKMIDCITIESDSDNEKSDEKIKISNILKKNEENYDLNLKPSSSNYLQNSTHTTELKTCTSSLKTPCNTEPITRRSRSATFKSKESLRNISPPVTLLPKLEESVPSNRSLSTNKEFQATIPSNSKKSVTRNRSETSINNKEALKVTSTTTPSFGQQMSNTSNDQSKTPPHSSLPIVPVTTLSRRKPKPCPPYKIIDGTTFAVDAFQFGYIENVTHYFLTHFHADHYIGLTRKFSMPLYLSPITARFVREFIPIDEQYINILELNTPHVIGNVEITALDANHCPGAIIIVFKFLDTGKCILHTGDFRAWHGMESEPIFWNNDIHTIYLDTTYISDKYAFCTQYESIDKAKQLIEKFQEKHQGKRILYICGAYVIGKEKFWSALAEEYELKVWAEGNRNKALKAMEDERLDKLLIGDPIEANMHVIPMGKLSYLYLLDYFSEYESHFDIVFAIRPSGWEKDSKPQYRGKINIVGIEYSEHSSYREMQRFVKFLKPQQVLSTVPTGRNLMITAKIPQSWYKYGTLKSSSNYQPTLDAYCRQTPLRKKIRLPNMNVGGLENFVSPLSLNKKNQREINNNNELIKEQQQVISVYSSENEFEQGSNTIFIKNEKENEIKVEQTVPSIKQEVAKEIENVDISKINTATKQKNSKGIKKKASPAKKNTRNSSKSKNENCSTVVTKSLLLANSSEDFEMPEILSNQNKSQRIKQTQQDNLQPAKNSKLKKNLIYEEISSTQKSSTVKDLKRKYQKQISRTTASEDEFQLTESQRTVIPRNSNKIRNTQNKSQQKQISLTTTSEEDTEVHISQTSKRKISNKILNSQAKAQLQQKCVITSSENDIEIPVSQKTRRKPSVLVKSTTQTQILEEVNQIETTVENLSKQNEIAKKRNYDLTTFQNLRNKPRKNLKNTSRTTSNTSISSNDEITSPTIRIEEYSPIKPLRDKTMASKTPPTYIPTPITKQNLTSNLIAPHIAPSISKLPPNPPNPLLKSTTTSNYSTSTEEILPSQTTLQQEYTPRPLRNKRNTLAQSAAYNPTPNKKSKDFPSANNNLKIPSSQISPQTVKDILKNNTYLDLYNHSQMAIIVEETLGKQCLDNSTDHIPSDLLSDPDADDDWMN